MGNVHNVAQGEGGEQGDPLMPALFSLGRHPALTAVQERLYVGERLLAFLDDIYVVCSQPGFWRCTASSKKSCGAMHAYRCIMGYGTEEGSAQKALKF